MKARLLALSAFVVVAGCIGNPDLGDPPPSDEVVAEELGGVPDPPSGVIAATCDLEAIGTAQERLGGQPYPPTGSTLREIKAIFAAIAAIAAISWSAQ